MSETKFTPGPWWIDGQGIGPKSFADDQSYGITTPVAYIEEYDWPENHVANAHLIAAAPELYEALEKSAEVFRVYQAHHEYKGDEKKAERNKVYAEQMEAVLNKARGEA